MRSFSIDDWCRLHGLSRSLFYKLANEGKAPKSFKVGRCHRISEEANNAWLAACEAAGKAVAA